MALGINFQHRNVQGIPLFSPQLTYLPWEGKTVLTQKGRHEVAFWDNVSHSVRVWIYQIMQVHLSSVYFTGGEIKEIQIN